MYYRGNSCISCECIYFPVNWFPLIIKSFLIVIYGCMWKYAKLIYVLCNGNRWLVIVLFILNQWIISFTLESSSFTDLSNISPFHEENLQDKLQDYFFPRKNYNFLNYVTEQYKNNLDNCLVDVMIFCTRGNFSSNDRTRMRHDPPEGNLSTYRFINRLTKQILSKWIKTEKWITIHHYGNES